MHQWPAGEVGDERRGVQAAGAFQPEGLGAAGSGVLGSGHRAREVQLALNVVDLDAALVEHEVLDGRQLGGLCAGLAHGPVVAAGLVRVEGDDGALDVYQRQLHVAGQQRQQLHLKGGLAELGHVGLAAAEPGRIADAHPSDAGPRLPREGMDLQMAFDHHLPAGPGGKVAGQGATEPVPAEQGEEHRHRDGDQRPDGGGADQPIAPLAVPPGVARAGVGPRAQTPQPFAEGEAGKLLRRGRGRVGQTRLPDADWP